MWNIILFLSLTISATIPTPLTDEDAQDRVDLTGFANLFSKNAHPQYAQETGYYPDYKQYGRERAVLEQEHWISRIDSKYNAAQDKVARYFEIKPLVDTIQEHEKYGNDGEHHRKIAKALVNGFDALGNTINSAVELPFRAKSRAGKTINAALDAIGSKLVGI